MEQKVNELNFKLAQAKNKQDKEKPEDKTVDVDENQLIKCTECASTFQKKYDLKKHIVALHHKSLKQAYILREKT